VVTVLGNIVRVKGGSVCCLLYDGVDIWEQVLGAVWVRSEASWIGIVLAKRSLCQLGVSRWEP